MTEIYGIYFFNKINGVDGFLIRTNNQNKKNFTYSWELKYSHWGLLRIKLMVEVSPESYRMVWMGDQNIFVETYEVGNFNLIPSEKQSIIKNTEVGNIIWNKEKGYWCILQDEIHGGVGINLNEIKKKKSSK